MNFSLIWAALVDPSKLWSTALTLVVDLNPAPKGPSPDASFYPPLDSISYITNNEYGTYGGSFTAPADEETPELDGAYNYCSMPHPLAERYQPPPPVQNVSVEAELIYVEYMQRHQRRTPYNILPGGEDQEYNCDNVHVTTGSTTANSSLISIPMYTETYTDPKNPMKRNVNGTCQYPQLTLGGVLDGYRHGRDLWAVYGEQMKLLPPSPDSDKVWFRASSSPLTHASASAVLRGIWPDFDGSLPLHQQPVGSDSVDQGFPCPSRSRLLSNIQSTDEWNWHLAGTQGLRDRLAALFDADNTDWMSTFDHFADNFQARLCNGYRLPCKINYPSNCVTEEQAYQVFRAGDWEWNYWWHRSQNSSTRYIQVTEGLFLKELTARFDAIANGTLDRVYSHTFIHDGDLGPILGALGIRQLRWPGMGANIAFEIWKTTDAQLYTRVLYSGHPLETTNGTLDWVPLSELTQRLDDSVPDDIVSLCNS